MRASCRANENRIPTPFSRRRAIGRTCFSVLDAVHRHDGPADQQERGHEECGEEREAPDRRRRSRYAEDDMHEGE